MAAGLPISLLRTPDYQREADRADRIFAMASPDEAWRIALRMGIDYLYVGRVELAAFGAAAAKFAPRPDLFERVFQNHDAEVFRVRETAGAR